MAALPTSGTFWADRDEEDSPDENSDEEASETEDLLQELSDEYDDDAVAGRMTFDSKFQHIPSPSQTLQFTARDQTIWSNDIPTTGRRTNVNIWQGKQEKPGPRENVERVKSATSMFDIFKLMKTEEMVDEIVVHTNQKGRSVRGPFAPPAPPVFAEVQDLDVQAEIEVGQDNPEDIGVEFDPAIEEEIFLPDVEPSDAIVEWKDTDRTEIYAFMGLIILAGAERCRKVPIPLIWTTDLKYRRPPFLATMSRNRFQDLLRFLRFDDLLTRQERRRTDKLAAIREFCDTFQANLYEIYDPGPYLVVDEMLVKFRGRCPFRVYMKSKPGRYGIKIWALVDCESRFVCNFQVYLGKQGDKPETNQGQRILTDMISKFYGTWRGVTADTFFGSKAAAEELMKNKLTSVFTIRAIRREVPKEILQIKVNDSKFCWNNNTMLVAYKAKTNKTVLLMSTQHQTPLIHKQPPHKPEVIFFYNATKGGVDTVDQMVTEYTCRRRSNRWPLTVFMELVDIADINTQKIWEAKNPGWKQGKTSRRLMFLRELTNGQILPRIRERSWNGLSTHVQECIKIMGVEPPSYLPPQASATRAYCNICKTKKSRTRQKCDICKNPCQVHQIC